LAQARSGGLDRGGFPWRVVPWRLPFGEPFSGEVAMPLSRQPNAREAMPDVHNFRSGDVVVATRDLRVRGSVVVRQGGRGCVVGPATSSGRICVHFEHREDSSDNRLNCMPDELRHVLAGGHELGSRVRAARRLEVAPGRSVAPGTHGIVVGPARDSPRERLVVRFAASSNGGPPEELTCEPDDVELAIAGDFRRGNAVIATRDLRVGGTVVVREGVLGTVVGPSSSDPRQRVTVSFSQREDGSRNRLNCVISEIRLYVAGGLEVGARVQATRTLNVAGHSPVQTATCGVVVGPCPEEPLEKLLVRFEAPPPQEGSFFIEAACRADDVTLVIAGGFRRGESVTAAKDLRVKGIVVVRAGVVGTVIGQSATDPSGRVTIAFARREDGRCNNLNVVPAEIRRVPCTGGLVAGDRVAARRTLLAVPQGTHGVVLGPSCARPSRVAVRFSAVDTDGDIALHIEPGDLRVLNTSDEVDGGGDESGPEPEEEDDGGDARRMTSMAVAGGFARGDEVIAARDLCVGGNVVVKASVLGTVIGPSSLDPVGRVTVTFAWREDGKTNNLNVMPSEIRPVEPPTVQRGELCAICLGELLADGEELCRMPCAHVLHASCVREYLSHHTGSGAKTPRSSAAGVPAGPALAPPLPSRPAQCPVCRRDVLP